MTPTTQESWGAHFPSQSSAGKGGPKSSHRNSVEPPRSQTLCPRRRLLTNICSWPHTHAHGVFADTLCTVTALSPGLPSSSGSALCCHCVPFAILVPHLRAFVGCVGHFTIQSSPPGQWWGLSRDPQQGEGGRASTEKM